MLSVPWWRENEGSCVNTRPRFDKHLHSSIAEVTLEPCEDELEGRLDLGGVIGLDAEWKPWDESSPSRARSRRGQVANPVQLHVYACQVGRGLCQITSQEPAGLQLLCDMPLRFHHMSPVSAAKSAAHLAAMSSTWSAHIA